LNRTQRGDKQLAGCIVSTTLLNDKISRFQEKASFYKLFKQYLPWGDAPWATFPFL